MEIDLSNKCRACLSETLDVHSLYEQFNEEINLLDILKSTTNFEIDTNDGLSEILCNRCTSVIVDFYNLKTIYQGNESEISALLSGGTIVEPEPEPEPAADETFEIKLEEAASEPAGCDEVSTFSCSDCNEWFFEEADIGAHFAQAHPSREFAVESYRVAVAPAPPKRNVCDACGLSFAKRSHLKDHQEVHAVEKRHVCGYCQKAFRRRTVLIKHKRIHTHPRECVCDVCGKAFNDRGTLKTHIRLLHTDERNFSCGLCGVRFPLKATLEKHVKRHGKRDRLFVCTVCSNSYMDKSSLDRHVLAKHSGKSVRFSCGGCGRMYASASSLCKHRKCCETPEAESGGK